MPTDRASASTRPALRRKPRHASGDDGSTLLEVLVALAVIGTVMAGTAPFLVKSVAVVAQQRSQQVAIEVANNALERVRALSPSSLLAGRGLTAVVNQLGAAPTEVQIIIGSLSSVDADATVATGAGATASLPTVPLPITVGGVTYQQNWYVKRCWQTKADASLMSFSFGGCLPVKPALGVVAPFFQVIVAVQWQHNTCKDKAGGLCVYVASTLVSPSDDPIFSLKRPPPVIISPGNQVNYAGDMVSFKVVASGGALPRSWTMTGLPAGLTVTSAGAISGQLTATPGTYSVTATVTDRELVSDDATFTWTVDGLVSPGAQVFRTSTAVSLPITLTRGPSPVVWSATGLPGGLSINSSTGIITGTPTATQATPQTATITVVDSAGKKPTTPMTFTWRVFTPVALGSPGAQSASKGDNGTYPLGPLATGGKTPYSWKATGLPAGVTIDASTGTTSGIITAGTRFLATIEVTDSLGGKASVVVLVTIANPSGLRVTTPNPTTPNQTSTVGSTVSLTAVAAGASGYAWSATGLPPGLTMSAAGVVTGKPTAAGTYTTTLTVAGSSQFAYMMLVWTVTP